MTKAEKLEREAGAATARFAGLQALSPEGAPIAWFPPRIRTFFGSHKIERVAIRLDNSSPYTEPELAKWSRFTWQFELPQSEFVTVGKALAELENTEPLLAVTRLTMRATGDNPQFQQVTLVASSTMPQK
jgi:hypothetical protein